MVTNSPSAAKLPTGSDNLTGLDRFFDITKRRSSVGQEIRGGLVTFFAMAYIIALNPLIIGTAADKNFNLISGAPKFLDAAHTQVDGAAVGASIAMVAAASALIAGVVTILMGVIAVAWLFPLLGLLVTSVRDKADVDSSGW